jgi:endonuclease/exonuclease/phosphatase family metal-dependent hydrolase
VKEINRVLRVALFLAALLIAFLFSSSMGEFTFDEVEELSSHEFSMTIPPSDTLRFFSWNIGYSGLGENMDFFYDGGRMVIPSRKQFDKYLHGILTTLKKNSSSDFFLLQEVDIEAKRSYRIPLNDTIASELPPMSNAFGINYASNFIPTPIAFPMGSVLSGVNTLASYLPKRTVRHALYTNFSWPKRLFLPHRCFLVNRHPMGNGQQLVVVNVHLSAYDDGNMRDKQLHEVLHFAFSEFNEGNYVVVGGDWNQTPPGYQSTYTDPAGHFIPKSIPHGAIPREWRWVYDEHTPTNRSLETNYTKNTPTSILDFFLVSPNIQVVESHTLDHNFKYSDHNPIKMSITFR